MGFPSSLPHCFQQTALRNRVEASKTTQNREEGTLVAGLGEGDAGTAVLPAPSGRLIRRTPN
jgi:hypothetical protein